MAEYLEKPFVTKIQTDTVADGTHTLPYYLMVIAPVTNELTILMIHCNHLAKTLRNVWRCNLLTSYCSSSQGVSVAVPKWGTSGYDYFSEIYHLN